MAESFIEHGFLGLLCTLANKHIAPLFALPGCPGPKPFSDLELARSVGANDFVAGARKTGNGHSSSDGYWGTLVQPTVLCSLWLKLGSEEDLV